MKAKDSFTVEKVKELKKLHGHCRLELLDESGKVIKSQEHDNAVTPWIANAINKGNFFDSIPSEKEFPLANWFSGVMLLSKQGDASGMTIPSDARVIACANNASGSDTTDLRRGNYNPDSSSRLYDANGRVNGFKFVWYWSDTRGNCLNNEYIKSVCLTRPDLAIARYDTGGAPADGFMNEHFNTIDVSETLAGCQIIDYENEIAYAFAVSGTTVNIKVYQLDTKQFHICGVYEGGVMDVTKLLDEHDITLTGSSNVNNISCSLVNGSLCVVAFSGVTVEVHTIDPSDWTDVSTSITYDLGQGVTILGGSGNTFKKDLILNDGSYLWLMGSDKNIYKCSLSNAADVTQYTAPVTLNNNACFMALDNGDIIKLDYDAEGTDAPALYFHDGVLYATRSAFGSVSWGWRVSAVNVTPYGTVLYSLPKSGRYGTDHKMQIGAAYGYVATVWNDTDGGGSADQWQKTAGRTMRVIYEITEEE